MISTILVPTDGSEHATKAVRFAADLAQKYGAQIILLHVVSDWGSGRVPDELRGYARMEHVEITERDLRRGAADEILRRAQEAAAAAGVQSIETMIEDGAPAPRILNRAKAAGADLIVMGSRGLGDLQGLLLGSVSHKVSHLAECTCITVR